MHSIGRSAVIFRRARAAICGPGEQMQTFETTVRSPLQMEGSARARVTQSRLDRRAGLYLQVSRPG
jgi:hypothetical protein